MKSKLKIGDKVRYKKAFLKSIGASPTDEMWFQQGVITDIKKYSSTMSLATIDGFIVERVNINNLQKRGSLEPE